MAFMIQIKKKRYKFHVDLCVDELREVTFSKAIMWAKVRQLDGGQFSDVSKRMEVQNHMVKYNARFQFLCKMNANPSSGILETCKCRISVRMEEKGGKHFRKIGFADINLAEYAGAGPSTQRYILQAYEQTARMDNSILQVTLNITLKEGDTIFSRPLTRNQPILLPGEESETSTPTAAATQNFNLTVPSNSDLVKPSDDSEELSHTRHSSTTSQTSAYSSQASAQGHSRESSSGESTHGRNLSQGSSDTGFYGSMEKEKRRKKLDEGRVDAELVINEIMEGVDLGRQQEDDAETSGLQLFVGKDGSVTFDKKSSSQKDFQQVVIQNPS